MEKINNIFYYLIIMLLFLFFSFYYHSHILFVLLFAMLIFPFFSIIITKYITKKIKLSIEINHYYCHTDKQYILIITAKNPTFIPVLSCNINLSINNFYYPNNILHSINFSVPALSSEQIFIPLSFSSCGCYTAEVKDIEVKDFLAFIKSKAASVATYQFNVFPIPENTEITNIANELSNDECLESQKSNSGTQIDGIRDYVMGDALKNIHWKLSAKADKLLVKEFYDSMEDSIVILIELYEPALNSILTTGFSVATNLIKNGHKIYLCWANSGDEQLKKQPVSTQKQANQCFSDIFLSYPTNINSTSLIALRREYDGTGIIYINAKENENKAVIDIL